MKNKQSSSFERLPRKQQNHKEYICYCDQTIQANGFRKYLKYWHFCKIQFPMSQKTNNICVPSVNTQG